MIAVDTGFLFALIDKSDAWHSRAVAALHTVEEGWITTWPVLTEATHLLTRWIGTGAAQALLREVRLAGHEFAFGAAEIDREGQRLLAFGSDGR